MEELVNLVPANIHHAPFVIFGLLLLAGLCLPVSEDAMLFISAYLAANNPEHTVPLFIGVYGGAYFSDLIAYTLGRNVGPQLWKFAFFRKMLSKEKVEKMHNFYERYGIITLIIGRFIPFGVRNALFISAGFGKMNFFKFALADLLACTISTSFFFPLYYYFGKPVVEYVKKGNIILFAVAATALTIFFVAKKIHNRKQKLKQES